MKNLIRVFFVVVCGGLLLMYCSPKMSTQEMVMMSPPVKQAYSLSASMNTAEYITEQYDLSVTFLGGK